MSRLSFSALSTKVGEKFSNYEIVLEDADSATGSPEVVLGLRPILRLKEADRTLLTKLQAAQAKKEADAAKLFKDHEEAVKAAEEAGTEAPVLPLVDAVADAQAYLRKYITLVADDSTFAEVFLDRVGDDTAFLAFVVGEHSKETQAGEASPSGS